MVFPSRLKAGGAISRLYEGLLGDTEPEENRVAPTKVAVMTFKFMFRSHAAGRFRDPLRGRGECLQRVKHAFDRRRDASAGRGVHNPDDSERLDSLEDFMYVCIGFH